MDTGPYVDVQIPGAERVADGLWILRGRLRHLVNAYVIGDVLLDSRIRQSGASILGQVRGLPLKAHALTHAHIDHMGASHEVCEALDLPLLCGAADVAAAESGCRLGLEGKPAFVRTEHRLLAGLGHSIAGTLREGEEIGGFTVIETPGHSPGHLAFWREADRVLIAGDVLFNLRPPLARPGLMLAPPLMTPHPAENLASARRLAELEPEIVCFGHGPPLRDPERFRRFVDQATYGA